MRPPCQCGRPHYARAMCENCYRRAKRAGRLDEHPGVGHVPEPPLLGDQLAARGWDVTEDDCWILHGVPNAEGYLYIGNGGRRLTAARAAWTAWCAPIPGGRQVRTTCRNGCCINPSHLVLKRIINRVCSVRGCANKHYGRTLCSSHYHKLLRAGRLDELPRIKVAADATPEERLRHIGWHVTATGCWIWGGGCTSDGYGRVDGGGSREGTHYQYVIVHRMAYEIWIGPIPKEHRVIQKCGNRECLAPDHLFTKDRKTFFLDMQAESIASRLIHEEAKPRRYRLSPAQVIEVDQMLRKARLSFMSGLTTKGEYEHEMLRIEMYVGYIRDGCLCPSIEQAIGMEVPDERRWENNGFQGPPDLKNTIAKRSKHGGVGHVRDRIRARQKARDAS